MANEDKKDFYMLKNKPEIVNVPKRNLLKIMDIAMTLAMADFIMKFICPMQERLLLRSGRP